MGTTDRNLGEKNNISDGKTTESRGFYEKKEEDKEVYLLEVEPPPDPAELEASRLSICRSLICSR